MNISFRNIAHGLLTAGVLAIVSATMSGLFQCSTGGYCNMASIVFGIPSYTFPQPELNTAVSTVAVSETVRLSSVSVGEVSNAVGVYLLVIGVLILVVLEFFELYYLRKFLGRRRALNR